MIKVEITCTDLFLLVLSFERNFLSVAHSRHIMTNVPTRGYYFVVNRLIGNALYR